MHELRTLLYKTILLIQHGAIEKQKEGFCLATKIRISFRDFQDFTGFFQK